MHSVRTGRFTRRITGSALGPKAGALIGLVSQLVLVAALAGTVGLGSLGWTVGILCGIVTNATLAAGFIRAGTGPGPADWVTLARATLVGGVAALIADSFARPISVPTLVLLAALALVLDAIDGRVARRTHTESKLGARFDLEVDAFLILILSVYVVPIVGAWVLLIGAARYLFVATGWLLPWLRAPTPPRYWAKVVAAIQGVVLTIAAADILPHLIIDIALVTALTLLAESFGRSVWWLWRNRQISWQGYPAAGRGRVTPLGTVGIVLAILLVWLALVTPNKLSLLAPGAFTRIPLEGLFIVTLALVLRPTARQAVAVLLGALVGLLLIVKLLDMGFFAVFDRPFNVLNDWSYFSSGVGVLTDSIGTAGVVATVAGAAVLVLGIAVVVPLSVVRLTRFAASHHHGSIRTVVVLGAVWTLCAVLGVQTSSGVPVASNSTASLGYDQVRAVYHSATDQSVFAAQIARDPLRDTPESQLLSGLRGKDVIVAFVESYGRVAVQDSSFSPGVRAALDAGTERLNAAGYSSRSAFLTSPTFGGVSWLAHSTLESGLWVNSQQRYDQLLARDRLTLTSAFGRAGWRTVFDIPADNRDWWQGSLFYRFDKLYDSRNVGYQGPKFSYATMPDQYVLAAFRRLELAKTDRPPIMAEIDLVSSHTPWTPLPHLVAWDDVGDGTIFDPMPAQGEPPDVVLQQPAKLRALYGQSITYSLNTIFSYLTTYPDPNLVMIVLGDHQPHSNVSGERPGHDVPISIIAQDQSVLDHIAGWGWQKGMLPDPAAPVWPMSAFRDRFLTAFGP